MVAEMVMSEAGVAEAAGGWTAGRDELQSVPCGDCKQTAGAVLSSDGSYWLCCFCQAEAWK